MDTYGVMYVITYFDKVYAALVNGAELPAPGVGPHDIALALISLYAGKNAG